MTNFINMGWFVLSKYYHASNESPVYTTALLLYSSHCQKYINNNQDISWHQSALIAARKIWIKYKDLLLLDAKEKEANYKLLEFECLAKELDITEEEEDKLEKFITGVLHKIICSPLQWWCKEEQRLEYRHLHHMAIDILSIPPISNEVE